MTDNVEITAGSGTTIASDDIGGAQYQRVKVTWGADGTANDASAVNPLPVTGVVTGSGNFASTVADGANVTLGAKADAKSTATDTTSISAMSVWKQVSASVQAAASSLAGSLTVGTHAVTASGNFASTVADGANVTLGAKADAKSTATDTTSISAMSVFKQISASVQSLVSGVTIAAAQTLATVTTVTTVATVTAVTAISNALPAGTNLLGKVKTKFINATASALTRPANQTPYTANDAVSDNGTAGSVTAKSVTLSDVNDDLITIERVRLATTDTGAQGKAFRMYLYNSDPTASTGVTGGDNAAFSNKQAGFIGTLSGTFTTFSDGGVAVLVPDAGSRIIATPTSGAKTVYWQLQTLDAFTSSANSTTFTPTFEGFQGAA